MSSSNRAQTVTPVGQLLVNQLYSLNLVKFSTFLKMSAEVTTTYYVVTPRSLRWSVPYSIYELKIA